MDVEDYLSLGYVCSLRQVLQEAERLSSLYPADSPARQGAVPADQRSHCAAGRREALHTPGPHVHGPRQGGGEDLYNYISVIYMKKTKQTYQSALLHKESRTVSSNILLHTAI